jgi:Cof subfamily protein (haloacid dehalogenase superfamily)
MPKTLYISDLDGTLLNSQAELSLFSINTLNTLIEKGMDFSIATARSSATALQILKDVKINIPIILMNGVCVYDILASKYIKTEIILKDSVIRMLDIFKKYNQTGFLFTMRDNNLVTYYENLNSTHRKNFYEERILKYKKVFNQVDSFNELLDEKIIYFSICDKFELIEPMYNELKLDTNINIEFYRDVYNENFWYLEICDKKASKYNATSFLKQQYNFDKVVCFGDNINDLPMFRASDFCYAVSNAKDVVKEKATDIIESNNENGVANWLKNNV